jgi:hypothetical protein
MRDFAGLGSENMLHCSIAGGGGRMPAIILRRLHFRPSRLRTRLKPLVGESLPRSGGERGETDARAKMGETSSI